MITVIVSGGQTGADQAALDAAISQGVPHSGWIPKGRLTENGPLDKKYHLQEMPTELYLERTEKNVVDSDGTLIFSFGPLTGGSLETQHCAAKHEKPWMFIDLDVVEPDDAVAEIRNWTSQTSIRVLNVAGPRASKSPKIYTAVFEIVQAVLTN